jgi:uncharacterized protein YbjT (DUF2867 family)
MTELPGTSTPTVPQKSPSESNRRILVVGVTGFLGSKILRHLEHDASSTLRALSRRGAPTGSIGTVEWVRGDMMDPASLDAALSAVDVVVSSANGYMKETIETDFQGNKNLIEAADRAGVKRFVFLSIVACDEAPDVPHFHAKKVAEDLIKASGLPYVLVRAPAFLDQSSDHIADGTKAGRFYVVGDKSTKWSYVLSDDLAAFLAKAAIYPGEEICNQTIDVGWRDGAKSQQEIADLITQVTGRSLTLWVVPWLVFRVMVRPAKLVSELFYDLMRMFLFFRTGRYVSDIAQQQRFFGPAPTARDAIARWAELNELAQPKE